MHVSAHINADACEGQKRESIPLGPELQFQITMCVLGTKSRSSARIARDFNH